MWTATESYNIMVLAKKGYKYIVKKNDWRLSRAQHWHLASLTAVCQSCETCRRQSPPRRPAGTGRGPGTGQRALQSENCRKNVEHLLACLNRKWNNSRVFADYLNPS